MCDDNKYEFMIFNEDYGVKTEIIMKDFDFEKFCKNERILKNSRSAVSSILNTSKDINKNLLQYLTIIPLQYQRISDEFATSILNSRIGFSLIEDITDFDYIERVIETMVRSVRKDGIPIDGVVITLANENTIKQLGRENSINKFEVAYKLPPEQKRTIVKDVIMSTGILGSITPVVIIVSPAAMPSTICTSFSVLIPLSTFLGTAKPFL